MKTNQKEIKNKNAYLSTYFHEHKGNVYLNYKLVVELSNGDIVELEVKPKFYNRKFDYMLKCNLPRE